MSNQVNDGEAGGQTNSNPGGVGEITDKNSQDIQEKPVSYETHKQLLDQRKADQKRLREIENELNSFKIKEKEIEEKKLRDQGEYQKILDAREKELENLRSENSNIKKSLVDGAKLQAFLDKLPGKIKKKDYLMFVDLEKIPFNPESNSVDEAGLNIAVSDFVKEYSDLIQPSTSKKLPGDPANPVRPLTYEQWTKLPLKEKRLRFKDVKD